MATTITGGSRQLHFGDDDTAYYSARPVTITGGDGNNTLVLSGRSTISLGDGDNSLTLSGGGKVRLGDGHDTITLGLGKYSIDEEGTASIKLLDGSASVSGGKVDITTSAGRGGIKTTMQASDGEVTMIGGIGPTTFIGGHTQDTMVGGAGADLFKFNPRVGGEHVVQNFLSGQDHLYIERLSYNALEARDALSWDGHNTTISLNDGTHITIEGVQLTAHDIVTR